MNNIIILGPPGAGKGTQAKLIAKEFNLIHLSSGELLRKEATFSNTLGKEIKNYQEKGLLVPNELLTKLIDRDIKKTINSNGFILDGYPRSNKQIDILNTILQKYNLSITRVININISEKEAINRLTQRGKNFRRADDDEKIIKKRFQIYYQQTKSIVDYYQKRNKLLTINGDKPILDVLADIKKEL